MLAKDSLINMPIALVRSYEILYLYSYPKFVYKGILGRTYQEYALLVIKNLTVATILVALAYAVSRLVQIDSLSMQLISDVVVAIVVPCLLLWVLHHNSNEYSYFVGLSKKILRKITTQKKTQHQS